MADVFISYSRKDSPFVGALAEGLRARGKDVWIDIEGIRDAEVFPEALREAIAESDGFVFVISPASVKSKYCKREVDDASDAGKRIVPVAFERVADEDVPEEIRVRNWIPGDDIEATVQRVMQALDTDLGHLKAHTHWEVKALEWNGKEREHSLLLRGADLAEAETWLGSAETKDPPPTPLQREYLTMSRQAAATRQRRVAIAAVAVALVSIALLVFAVIQRGQAQSARKTNESRAIAFASEAQDAVNPERALLMAVTAVKTRPTPDSLFALRSALDANPLLHRYPSFGPQNCQQSAPSVSFSPQGGLAVGLCSGRVILYDAHHHKIGSILQPDPAAPLRFNPDGSSLAVAGAGKIRLYDPQTLLWQREVTVPGYAQRIIFSGDGSRMAATSVDARSWTSVWDAHSGKPTMRTSEPTVTNGILALVRGIAFVDGNRALAIGSPTGPVTIRTTDGGRLLRTLPDDEDEFLGFDPGGHLLAVAGFHTRGRHSREGVVTVFDTHTWKSHVVAAEPGLRPRNMFVSPDATRIAVGWSDGSADVYSLALGSRMARFLGPPKPVSALAFTPDSQTVAVAAGDGSVRTWHAGGAERAYAEVGSRLPWDEQPSVSANALTVVTPPNLVHVFTVPALDPLTTSAIPLPRGATYTNAWLSPSGNIAAMTRSDRRMDVWDLRSDRRKLSLPALPGALAAMSKNDRAMILLDGQHNELVDLHTHVITPIRQRASCRGQWQFARFSDDGSTVIGAATCAEVFAWDARTGKLLRRFLLPGQTSGLALSHDKKTVAIASPEGRLILIDLRSGAQRAIPGAPRGLNSVDFGAGDRTLAGGANDKTIRVWDTASGRLLRELPLEAVGRVRFTLNGRELVASELTGAVKVFASCPGCGNAHALLAEAERRATRKLTPAERRTYLSGF